MESLPLLGILESSAEMMAGSGLGKLPKKCLFDEAAISKLDPAAWVEEGGRLRFAVPENPAPAARTQSNHRWVSPVCSFCGCLTGPENFLHRLSLGYRVSVAAPVSDASVLVFAWRRNPRLTSTATLTFDLDTMSRHMGTSFNVRMSISKRRRRSTHGTLSFRAPSAEKVPVRGGQYSKGICTPYSSIQPYCGTGLADFAGGDLCRSLLSWFGFGGSLFALDQILGVTLKEAGDLGERAKRPCQCFSNKKKKHCRHCVMCILETNHESGGEEQARLLEGLSRSWGLEAWKSKGMTGLEAYDTQALREVTQQGPGCDSSIQPFVAPFAWLLAIAEVLLLLFPLRLLSHSGSCPIHPIERLGKSVLPALFTQAWTQSLRSRYLKYPGTPCTDTSYLGTKVDRRVGPGRSLHNPATAHVWFCACIAPFVSRSVSAERLGLDAPRESVRYSMNNSPKTNAYTGSFGKKWPNRTECQAPVRSLSYPPKRIQQNPNLKDQPIRKWLSIGYPDNGQMGLLRIPQRTNSFQEKNKQTIPTAGGRIGRNLKMGFCHEQGENQPPARGKGAVKRRLLTNKHEGRTAGRFAACRAFAKMDSPILPVGNGISIPPRPLPFSHPTLTLLLRLTTAANLSFSSGLWNYWDRRRFMGGNTIRPGGATRGRPDGLEVTSRRNLDSGLLKRTCPDQQGTESRMIDGEMPGYVVQKKHLPDAQIVFGARTEGKQEEGGATARI
ncbi:hypothetical protein CCUS01_05923 [Colletotrichum cuscutae]|uniref:Uncharacterized protein n=1 Tax=Colletotrichum cuscutae TaxID=1209917 RepID=A0AAI9Y3E1_9PEZI|nr:hypothetical protein CCUS01_05923 [Colletotrichum cuscutae]